MSREIKFRVWNKNTNKYEYTELDYYFVIDQRIKAYEYEQYTGLKDKNGKEIYEGDIVNIVAIAETDDSDMAYIIDTNSIVCWDKEHARWDVNDEPEDKDWDYRRRRYFVFVDNEGRENVEVIGNIHENPELLGEQIDGHAL